MTSYKPTKVTVPSLWLESGLGEHLSSLALPLLMVLLPAVTLPPMQLLLPSPITPGPCRRRHPSHSGLGEHLPGPALPLLMVLPPAVVLTAAPAAVLAADITLLSFVFSFVFFFLFSFICTK